MIRLDDTGFGGIEIYQDPELFCYGVDAVLLADFCAKDLMSRKHRDLRIVDLCTGNGIVPLILSHKTDAEDILGIEIQERCYKLAVKSTEHNGLGDRLHFRNADIAELLKSAADQSAIYDAVTCNPPYTKAAGGISSESCGKLIARHETTAGLEEFIAYSARLLKDKGSLYMVHRPSRIVDIIYLGRKLGMEPKAMRFVSGKRDTEPNIVLVQLVKNGGAEMKLKPQMYTREEDGSFSEELLAIYERL